VTGADEDAKARDALGDARKAPHRLDDEADREELRTRYYGLLQELRVVLPGVQLLSAFLLTVPFAQRFGELDSASRGLFGAALLLALSSVVAFVTPAALHRFGERTARAHRLAISIMATRIGLLLLAGALICSLTVVARFLYSDAVAYTLVGIFTASVLTAWLLVPFLTRHDPD
jgi:hypothetical protein